jgi:hypothetical protein
VTVPACRDVVVVDGPQVEPEPDAKYPVFAIPGIDVRRAVAVDGGVTMFALAEGVCSDVRGDAFIQCLRSDE